MLKTIQAGRGFAALAVTAFHLSILLGDPRYLGGEVLRKFTWKGELGVDFFFVLSGFIIMFAHHKDIDHPEFLSRYVLKRFIRIYPIYWVYLSVFCLLLAFGFGTAAQLPKTSLSWISSFSLVRLLDFVPPIPPAWTLFHEVAFYAMFSALILNRFFGIVVLTVWGLLILAFFQYVPDAGITPFSTLSSAYNLNFFIGIGVFFLSRRMTKLRSKCVLVSSLILFVGVYWMEARGTRFGAFPLLYALTIGGMLAGGVSWEKNRSATVLFPFAVLLGNASYTIYLTHEAFLGLFAKIAVQLNHVLHIESHSVYAIVFLSTVVSGCGVYLLVEKPLLTFLRHRLAGIWRQAVLRPIASHSIRTVRPWSTF